MPLSLLFDPDSFYFGVLPVIAEVAGQLGVPAVKIGQAALLGQMTTGFPISPLTPATFLVCRADRHRSRRSPEIHLSPPVRCVDRDDDRLRRAGHFSSLIGLSRDEFSASSIVWSGSVPAPVIRATASSPQ